MGFLLKLAQIHLKDVFITDNYLTLFSNGTFYLLHLCFTVYNIQAPPRADVIKSLKNGIVLNILGMGAAVLGMQATVGLLVAKALTTSANPYQGLTPGYSPVLALDVFLVQVDSYISLYFSFCSETLG